MIEDLWPVFTALVAGVSIWFGHKLGATEARKDRLRALYTEVLAAAIRVTPRQLGYKLGADADVPEPHQLDGLMARLMVESAKDDVVRAKFMELFNFIGIYAVDARSNAANAPELMEARQAVDKALHALQDAIRDRLK